MSDSYSLLVELGFGFIIAAILVIGISIKVRRNAFAQGLSVGAKRERGKIVGSIAGSPRGGNMKGKGFLVLILVVGLAGAALLMVGPALPSAVSSVAVPVEAQAQATETTASMIAQTTVVTIEVPVGSSVLVVDGQKFVEEIHRHDEVMSKQGYDAVTKVAVSGDAAQGIQAVSAAIQGSLMGLGLLAVGVGMAVVVVVIASKKASS